MGFIMRIFSKPKPPVIIAPPAPAPKPQPAPKSQPKTEVEQIIETTAKEAAVEEVKRTKKRRATIGTILTSGLGITEQAPVIRKKLGG